MLRAVVFVAAMAMPAAALAQQSCTTDARYVVDQIYRVVLERAADRNAAGQIRQLRDGTATVKDIVRELVKSAEHTSRFARRGDASANERTVTTLYRHILGRDPDPSGLQAHLQGLNTQGLEAVINAMLDSPEYQEKYGDYGVPHTAGLRYCQPANAGAVGSTGTTSGLAVDANRDGRIDRWEWKGTWQEFDAQDRNGDGVLSGSELGAVGTSGYQNTRFARLDRNGDGRIERNEWNGRAAQFNRLDVNRNNLLEPDELAGTAGRGSEVTFTSLDRNRDNRITIEEWNWNRRSFNQQDTDGDGVIMPWEFTGAPARGRR